MRALRFYSAAALLVIACWAGVVAAEVVELGLDDAVRVALQRSPTAQRLEIEGRRDDLSWASSRRTLWPELEVDVRAPLLSQDFAVESVSTTNIDSVNGGEVSQQVFVKTTTTRTNAAGGLHLRQLLPWRGRVHASSSVFYRDEETNPVGVRSPRLDYQLDARVGLDVQLLGDDADRRAVTRASIENDMSRVRLSARQAQLVFEATSGYLALLRSSLSLGIVRRALQQTERALDQARRKVETGLLPEVELLRMQVVLSERRAVLAQTETQVAHQSDAFKDFLGVPLTDSLLLSERLRPFEVEVSLDDAVAVALQRRAEIGLAERELELLDLDRRARRPYVPDVALSLRYGGAASEPRFEEALSALAANNLAVEMSLRMPIWDGGRGKLEEQIERAGVRLQELELDSSRRSIELEVRDAVRQLREAQRRRELFQASSELAEESLRISAERFDRGLVDTDGYLAAQAEAASVRLGLTGALLDLYQARARLHLVTMSASLTDL
jgi:outer membrane protein TolC